MSLEDALHSKKETQCEMIIVRCKDCIYGTLVTIDGFEELDCTMPIEMMLMNFPACGIHVS